jgi:adenylate cyclase
MLSVRAKLICLIALCVLPLAVATLLISRALEREQHDDSLERMRSAEKSFEAGLAEDVARLQIAVRMLTADPDVARALEPLDAPMLRQHVLLFGKVWPGLRVLILDRTGKVLASSHSEDAGGAVSSMPEVRRVLAGATFEGLTHVAHGPRLTEHLGHAYAVVQPLLRDEKPAGAVLAAFPLDSAWLENAQQRHSLGLTLSIGGEEIARSSAAPPERLQLPTGTVKIHKEEGRIASVIAFEPALLRGSGQPARVTASLDLTELARDHYRFLIYRLIAIAAVALIALFAAARIARRMNAAVKELTRVLPGVAQQRYEPVVIVPSGDELEALSQTWNRIVTQLREGDLWRRALGKYLSRAALEAVKKGDLALGGITLPATVLFSDIRGFTALAERMPPEKVLRILNRYFTEMVTAVMRNEGIVDKFIGDSIMAVWGPPKASGRDAAMAVRAALEMRRRLAKLNLEFAAEGLATLKIGIGVHSGDVVAGNIGAEGDESSNGKMEYTVIGDTVNLASRLESATKELQTDVVLSGDTVALAGSEFAVEAISEMKIRGREQPVKVFRLLGLREVEAEKKAAG